MIRAVLLAAGASSRMGRHKLLLDFGGETLLRRSARALLHTGLPLTVVLGRDPERLRAALAGLDLHFVTNPDYARTEVPQSLALALSELPAGTSALMALADMPFVTADHHRRVLATGEAGQAVLSRYGQVVAPPHLIPAALTGEVMEAVRQGLPQPVPRVLRPNAQEARQPPADLQDIDTPADYAQALARLGLG